MTAQLPSREDVNNALFRLTTPLHGIIEKDSTALMDKVALEKIATHLTQITNAYCALLAAHEQEPVAWTSQRSLDVNDKITAFTSEESAVDYGKSKAWVNIVPLYAHPAPVPAVPMAVAGFDAATAIRACMEEFPESMHDIIEECAQIAENTISINHAAPVPAVPDEMSPSRIQVLALIDGYELDDDEANVAADAWNLCRAAMLNGGKS